jgi:hypothetical protein
MPDRVSAGGLIALRGVSKHYGAVVDDIDLTEEYPAEDVIRHVGWLG